MNICEKTCVSQINIPDSIGFMVGVLEPKPCFIILVTGMLGGGGHTQYVDPYLGTYTVVKVDGDRHSQKVAWRVVRGHDKRIHGIWGFLKWWYPTTIGFPTKSDNFGVFWGCHHLRKHPPRYITFCRFRPRWCHGSPENSGEKADLSKEGESSIHIYQKSGKYPPIHSWRILSYDISGCWPQWKILNISKDNV